MKFWKFILLFLLLSLVNFILKWFGLNVLSFNHLAGLKLENQVIIYIEVLFSFIIMYLAVLILNKIIKKGKIQILICNINKNKLKYFIYVNAILLLLFSDYIYLTYSIFYYYLFKKFFNNNSLICFFYLDYSHVKNFTLLYFILEIPFLLFLMYLELFENDSGPNYWILVYVLTSLFLFYFPIFIASWWDNRKLQKNNCFEEP